MNFQIRMSVVALLFILFITNVVCIKEYTWIIDREFIALDCVEKLLLTINGEFPGPQINVKSNETVIINVYNSLPTETITIHWHGQHQYNTPFMDGISKISQCPIPPYSHFTYKFNANYEMGTYFYHIHAGALIDSGAYGAFVVYNDSNNTNNMDEFTMIIADHYHRNTDASLYGLLQKTFRWTDDPNNILINGKAIYNCTSNEDYVCSDDLTQLCIDNNNSYVCGAFQRPYTTFNGYLSCQNNCNYEEFNVVQGNTYLFRLINSSP